MSKLNIKKFGRFSVLLVMYYGFFALNAYATNSTDHIKTQMDSLLERIYGSKGPGASVLVVKDGKTIFRKGYGIANIEHNIPISPEMVFRIGSISKQFTAAAIMKLVDEKKINLNDPLTKFLPDYPVHGHNITIENLLTHTSGIKSYTRLPETMNRIDKKDLTVEELLSSFKNEPMDFAPSTAYLYNNSGYTILGAIIEKVTGQKYEDYIQDNFFTPLKMNHSYYGSFTKIIPNRVTGYRLTKDGVENAPYISMRVPYSAGSLLSSVDDLWKWDKALYSGKVVSPKSLKKMTTPFILSNGKSAGSEMPDEGYGFALAMSNLINRLVIGHSGSINGFSLMMQRIEKEKLLVIVLTNIANAPIHPRSVTNQLMAIAMGEPFSQPKVIEMGSASLKKYAGEFRDKKDGTKLRIFQEKGQLFSQTYYGVKRQIQPYSNTDFFIMNDLTRFSFSLNEKGVADQVLVKRTENEAGAIYVLSDKN